MEYIVCSSQYLMGYTICNTVVSSKILYRLLTVSIVFNIRQIIAIRIILDENYVWIWCTYIYIYVYYNTYIISYRYTSNVFNEK